MNTKPYRSRIRRIRYLALAITMLVAGQFASAASSIEYEIAGEYSFQKRMFFNPQVLKQYDDFVKEQTPPGQPAKRSPEMLAKFERARGIKVYGDLGMLSNGYSRRKFHLYVRDRAWLLRLEAPEMPLPYVCEIGGASDTREILHSRRSTNGIASGMIYLRTMPHSFVSENGAPMIWMMCASSLYLESLTNNLVWPVHHPYAEVLAGDPNLDARQWAMLERVETIPRLPSYLGFYNVTNKYTNAVYMATAWTNVGKLTLPTAFYWERLNPPRYASDRPQDDPIERMDAKVTFVSSSCSRKDLKPTVYPGMGISDRRVNQPAGYATVGNTVRKGYVLTGKKWVSQAEAQDLVDGRKRRPWHWVAAAAGTVCGFGIVVWWLRRSRWGGGIIPRG